MTQLPLSRQESQAVGQIVPPGRGNSPQFADRLLDTFNHGALCLMISIGHRTGLFDSFSQLPPVSSRELADDSTLDERYVREWLGAMVVGGIVDFDPLSQRYSLPADHAAVLTRGAGADNMALVAQYIGVLGGVEDDIVRCFREGGGVSYERYPRFHEVMAEESGQSVLSCLESHILPLAPGLTARLERGIRVLDLGCGRGRVLNRLASLYPNSHFTGIDLSTVAIDYARTAAIQDGLSNLEYIVADLSNFDHDAEPDAFDFVTTFDAVHDQPWPLKLLAGIQRTLKPDGVYLMQDINGTSHVHLDAAHPLGAMLYTMSCMHCMTVSLAQGGEGVGAMWGEQKTCEYLRQAGFTDIVVHKLDHDLVNNWYVIGK